MTTFFDEKYQTPAWLSKKLSRRMALKSAAGASALVTIKSLAGKQASKSHDAFLLALTTERWKTLEAVYEHLFPSSESGPGAKELQATFYLYQLVTEQPTDQDEIDFVFRGVGWLNSYTQNKLSANFYALSHEQKETMLRGISQSQAGSNWLNMMILNLYEAMLSPPAYGGNPNGIGWTWLKHQGGFPLPEAGQRYFELPPRSQVLTTKSHRIKSLDILALAPSKTLSLEKKS